MKQKNAKVSTIKLLTCFLLIFVMIFPLAACNSKDSSSETEKSAVGISDTVINENGELIITFTDGTQKNLGVIVGKDGADGTDGKDGAPGKNGTNGSKGDKGDKGNAGVGISKAEINKKGELILTFTDGTQQNLGVITGSATTPVDASYYTGKADTSWYSDTTKKSYHLTSADMLAGLASLVNGGTSFDGVTIYLDCNVIWNDGEFSVASNGDPLFDGAAPKGIYEWTPIGKNTATPNSTFTEADGFTNQFHGNFDGQGHYISGLYTNNRDRIAGLFTVFSGKSLKNLSIINSYFGGDRVTGSFFAGCLINDDWGAEKNKVSVNFENLYSNAYIVTDVNNNSRSGGIGGMLRPLPASNAAVNGFIAEFNNCWFDGSIYSIQNFQYSGGILGVAAYNDVTEIGSKVIFNDCLVTANMYASGGHLGMVLGNIYIGIAELNNVVAIIKDTNMTSVSSSGVVGTLEGNNGSKVTVRYDNVFYATAGGIKGTSYRYHKTVKGTTGIVEGTPMSDQNMTVAAATLGTPFIFNGKDVSLKTSSNDTETEPEVSLFYRALADDTYEVIFLGGTSDTVTIPATYKGKAVTKIADSAFAENDSITSIVVPASIKEIGSNAFKNATAKLIYQGTKSDWEKIEKADDWTNGSTVVCTDGMISSLKLGGVPMSEYTIVLPERFLGSDYRVAVYLKKHLDFLCGTNLEIQTDAKDYGHEILIGATKRTTAKSPSGHEYSADLKDGDLQLQAASVYAYDALNTYLTSTLFKDRAALASCSSGFSYTEDIVSTLTDGQEYTTKRDGDMRIMFFNMWGNSTTKYGPRDQHQMLAAEIVNAYAPDIIGFQEFNNHNRNDGWWSMDSLLEAYGYTEIDVSNFKNDKSGQYMTNDGTEARNNFTPIFYNAEKVTLLEVSYVSYDVSHNDMGSKSLSWAIFRDNETDKKFGVLATHFWWADTADGNKARIVNAEVVNGEVAKMLQKYPDIPIFVGGDFNCTNSSDPYKKLINEGGLVDVQGIAARTETHATYHAKQEYNKMFVAGNKNVGIDVNLNNEESDSVWIADGYLGAWTTWYHPDHSYKNGYNDAIDHIFIKGQDKVEIKAFDIIASKMALLASDHCPLIVDFNLK